MVRVSAFLVLKNIGAFQSFEEEKSSVNNKSAENSSRALVC